MTRYERDARTRLSFSLLLFYRYITTKTTTTPIPSVSSVIYLVAFEDLLLFAPVSPSWRGFSSRESSRILSSFCTDVSSLVILSAFPRAWLPRFSSFPRGSNVALDQSDQSPGRQQIEILKPHEKTYISYVDIE